MDGVSVLGLVVNVFQVVELGIKLARGYASLREGQSAYATVKTQADELLECTQLLNESIEREPIDSSRRSSVQDLLKTSRQCWDSADALRKEVQKYEVPPEGSGRRRKLWKIVVKTTLGRTEVPRLEAELKGYQNVLQTRLLGDLR